MKTKPKNKTLPKKGKSKPASRRDTILTAEGLREMTAKEQADMDAHIAGQAHERKPVAEEAIAEFFLRTPAIQEAKQTAMTAANQRYRDFTTLEIRLPKSTLAFIQLLERDAATAAKRKPLPVKKFIAEMLINHFQMEVNTVVTAPLSYRYYRQIWNRVCDMHHAPEHKISEDPKAETETQGGAEKGPF